MISCPYALIVAKEWLEDMLAGRQQRVSMIDFSDALEHIQKCREYDCSKFRQDLNKLVQRPNARL